MSGVAILSHVPESSSKSKKVEEKTKDHEENGNERSKRLVSRHGDRIDPRLERVNRAQMQLQQMMKEMEEQEKAQLVKLGDS